MHLKIARRCRGFEGGKEVLYHASLCLRALVTQPNRVAPGVHVRLRYFPQLLRGQELKTDYAGQDLPGGGCSKFDCLTFEKKINAVAFC